MAKFSLFNNKQSINGREQADGASRFTGRKGLAAAARPTKAERDRAAYEVAATDDVMGEHGVKALNWQIPDSAAARLQKEQGTAEIKSRRGRNALFDWRRHIKDYEQQAASRRLQDNAYAEYRRATDKTHKNSIKSVLFTGLIVLLISFASVWRLFDLTVLRHKDYVAMAANQRLQREITYPERGNIYDADGTLLALTTYVYNIGVSPASLRSYLTNKAPSRETIARKVGEIIGIDPDKMAEIATQVDKPYIQLKRDVPADIKNELQNYLNENSVYGIVVDPVMTRYYPQNEYLSQVIGFSAKHNEYIEGITGVERWYNEQLSGQRGVSYKEVDNFNRQPLNNMVNLDVTAEKGDDVYLTIRKSIQDEAQRQVDALTEMLSPRMGVIALVAKVDTGEILAMAQNQSFNLNEPYAEPYGNALRIKYLQKDLEEARKRKEEAERQRQQEAYWAQLRGETLPEPTETTLSPEEIKKEAEIQKSISGAWEPFTNSQDMAFLTGDVWSNFSVQKSYEPGSIFKPFTLAIALQRDVVDIKNDYFSDEPLWVEGWMAYPIKCWSENMFGVNHGTETIDQALWYSCNPPFARLAERIGIDPFFDYVVKLGFYDRTGIDLPGEGVGVQHALKSLLSADLATLAFGEQATSTPIQIIAAYCALANGGQLVQPHVVQKVTDTNGNIKEQAQTKTVRQVFSKEVSKTVVELMRGVTHDGYTGQYSYVTGLDLAAKTGTSTIDTDGDGKDDLSCFSTVLIGTAENPQYVVLVSAMQPEDNDTFGTWTVQMAARRIAAAAHNELHMKSTYTDYDYVNDNPWRKHIVLDYLGMPVKRAYLDAVEVRGLELIWPKGTDVDNEMITEQWPATDARLIDDGKVFVGTAKHPLSSLNIAGNVDVPDFTGLDIVAAKALARESQINIVIDGDDPKGVVVSQDIQHTNEVGVINQIRKWAVVRLRFTTKPYNPAIDDVDTHYENLDAAVNNGSHFGIEARSRAVKSDAAQAATESSGKADAGEGNAGAGNGTGDSVGGATATVPVSGADNAAAGNG